MGALLTRIPLAYAVTMSSSHLKRGRVLMSGASSAPTHPLHPRSWGRQSPDMIWLPEMGLALS